MSKMTKNKNLFDNLNLHGLNKALKKLKWFI